MQNNFLKMLQSKTLATALLVAFFAATGIAQELTKANIEAALNEAYEKFKDLKEGANADYTPNWRK